MTKLEIIKLYLGDLHNLVTESPARENRIAMLESEIVELEKQEPNDNFCDLCGRQMTPKSKEHIELLCMNPECDNYIKVSPYEGRTVLRPDVLWPW
jgi:hypothetical protein